MLDHLAVHVRPQEGDRVEVVRVLQGAVALVDEIPLVKRRGALGDQELVQDADLA